MWACKLLLPQRYLYFSGHSTSFSEVEKEGDESDSTADDIKFIPKNTNMYDASWDVYEIVELSLPIQRTHQVGECNEDMLSRICYNEEECI